MYLGLDLGTSGVKAMLMDGEQRIIGSASGALDVDRPHPGWSEQDPADWIRAAEEAIARLRETHPQALPRPRHRPSGQMHGATLLDEGDASCGVHIVERHRSFREAQRSTRSAVWRVTGNIVFPGFTAPKLAWVRENSRSCSPGKFAGCCSEGLPAPLLTGEHMSECRFGGTSWLDTGQAQVVASLLAATHSRRGRCPNCRGTDVAGTLARARDALGGWGWRRGRRRCGRQRSLGLRHGDRRGGAGFVSLGTSGVLFAANEAISPTRRARSTPFHALPNTCTRWADPLGDGRAELAFPASPAECCGTRQ